MKLSDGNYVLDISSAPQHWPCWLKHLPKCRVVSPWVGDGWCLLGPTCQQVHSVLFVACQTIAASPLCSVQYHLHTCFTEKLWIIWSLKKICKSPQLSWKVKVRPVHPGRKLLFIVNVCQTEMQTRSISWLLVPSKHKPAPPEASDFLFLINRKSQDFTEVFSKHRTSAQLAQFTLTWFHSASQSYPKLGWCNHKRCLVEFLKAVNCRPTCKHRPQSFKCQNYVPWLLNWSWKDIAPLLISLYQVQ